MEDPKVYELLSLMLDEMKATRQEFRTGLERLEHRIEKQTDVLEHFFHAVAAPQSAKIIELERRLEAVERKVA